MRDRWTRSMKPAHHWDRELRIEAAEDAVFVGTGLSLTALSASTGDVRWTTTLGAGSGSLLAPRVWADLVFATSWHALFCLDRTDGQIRWLEERIDNGILSSRPVVAGDAVVIGSRSGNLVAYDARSGAPRWKEHIAPCTLDWPVSDGERVYISGGQRGLVCAHDARDGTRVWRIDRKGARILAGPIDEVLYVGDADGALLAVDTASVQVRRIGGPIDTATGAVCAHEVIVAWDGSQGWWAFDAALHPALWRVPAGTRVNMHNRPLPPPAVTGTSVLLATDDPSPGLVLADLITGVARGRWDSPGGPVGAIAASLGMGFAATDEGITCLELD